VSAWYERSFGKEYLELYAHRDLPEACANIGAIDSLLALPKDEPLLDLCCGGGRCLVALRRAGFTHLVGLDLSGDLLEAAVAELHAEGVPEVLIHEPADTDAPEPSPDRVVLVRSDMRRIPYRDYFATVLSIFTSFGYFEADEDNLAVLQEAYRALRPGGIFLLDYLSRDWVVAHLVPEDERRLPDRVIRNQRRITPDGRRVEKVVTVAPEGREPLVFNESVRMYTGAEMRRMLASAGFTDVETYGSLSGESSGRDSQRLVLVGRKGSRA